MSNWSKSVIYGGIYTNTQSQIDCLQSEQKITCKNQKFTAQLEKYREIGRKSWEKSKNLPRTTGAMKQLSKQTRTIIQAKWSVVLGVQLSIKNSLKSHISEKQEFYWPVLIAIILLLFVFASKIAFAKEIGAPNNLPLSDNSKLNMIGFEKKAKPAKNVLPAIADTNRSNEDLKQDVAKIVKNTPMAAMIDPISENDRTVAAFIVGIAMKESKFGVYAPHIGGRDCYNYWGLKAGGKTTAGGYSCFSSPDEAVSVVG